MPVFRDHPAVADDNPSPMVGPYSEIWLSGPGRLTQFGCLITILPPGSRSSVKHWHATQDELIYVLAGKVTLHEGDAKTEMTEGHWATFKAGDPVGHCFVNESDGEVRLMVMGTRNGSDVVTYPDDNRVLRYDDAAGTESWTDFSGNPATNVYGEP
jgi:uncharacterized cupin superfamily protein